MEAKITPNPPLGLANVTQARPGPRVHREPTSRTSRSGGTRAHTRTLGCTPLCMRPTIMTLCSLASSSDSLYASVENLSSCGVGLGREAARPPPPLPPPPAPPPLPDDCPLCGEVPPPAPPPRPLSPAAPILRTADRRQLARGVPYRPRPSIACVSAELMEWCGRPSSCRRLGYA
jgi:hypothetical protein